MVRIHFQPTIWVTEDLEISTFGLVSSQANADATRVFAPSPARCRRMLCDLHEHLQLPIESFAAMCGVPRITMRKWLSGERNPSGAAKRLIWVLHCAIFDPRALRKLDGWLKWAGSDKEALEQFIEDRSQPVESTSRTPPWKEPSHDTREIRNRRLQQAAKVGQHLGPDIPQIGMTMLVEVAEKVRQSIAECDACLAREGLAPLPLN